MMQRAFRFLGLLAAATWLLTSSASAQMVDGTVVGDEAFYGAALSTQNTNTQFGNAMNGDSIDGGGGSEINQVFATVANGRLNVLVTGNLEPNFNKLEVFIDSVSGGHNTLDGSSLPTGVDGFCCGGFGTTDGALQRMNGLTFDTGFEADYYLTFSNGFENALDDPFAPGNPITFWAMSAHYSDMTAGAAADRQNVAAGMQLAPRGLPNVLRFDHLNNPVPLECQQGSGFCPYLPNVALNGQTDPTHIGPALPGLGQAELIDRPYAMSANGGCIDDAGTGCVTNEIEFALDQAPGDPTNALSHRNFNNLVDLQMAFDNSNTVGVNGSGPYETPTTEDPTAVTSGIEFSIPLAEIGSPTGDIRLTAFVNGTGHDFASNQFAGEGILSGNLGNDGMGGFTTINLASIAGDQFVTIANASTPTCDFDGNGACFLEDIDELSAAIAGQSTDLIYDLNGDMVVDIADLDEWRAQAGALNLDTGNPYLKGDANLDGSTNGQDFVIWNTNKFQNQTAWSLGNFNADTAINGQDFVIWNTFKFQTSGMSNPAPAVPEPTSVWLIAVGMVLLVRRRSSRVS